MRAVSLIYLSYIRNIFFTWTDNRTDPLEFPIQLNIKHSSIKFEYEISEKNLISRYRNIFQKQQITYQNVSKENGPPNLS